MVRLPTREALGPLPNVTPPRDRSLARINIAVPDTSAEARGVQNLGRGIAVAGDALQNMADRQAERELQRDKFEADRKFHEFAWQREQELGERTRQIQPGQARGFADRFSQDYVANGKAFMAGVPEHLRQEFDARLFGLERSLYRKAFGFEQEEQRRYSIASLEETASNVYARRARAVSTESLEAVQQDFRELVQANPDLTPIEKDKYLNDALRDMTLAHLDALPPDRVKPVLEAGGPALVKLSDRDRQTAIERADRKLDALAKKIERERLGEELMSGTLPVDPSDKDHRKVIDEAYGETGLNDALKAMDTSAATTLAGIAQTTGLIPGSALSLLRGMAINGSPEAKTFAYQTTAQILRAKPGILEGREGARELRDGASRFDTYVFEAGLSSEEAIKRIEESRSEEGKRRAKALKAEADDLVKKIEAPTITSEFDPGIFSAEPELGGNDVRGRVILNTYRELFKDHYVATADETAAHSLALKDLKRTYDVSGVTGTNRLMKHPPEKYYPLVDGSLEYFGRQLERDVNERVNSISVSGRPLHKTASGEPYSEKTVTFPLNGKWYTFPSVLDRKGTISSEEQVIDYVKKNGAVDPLTGEKFPSFDTVEAATAFAKKRSSTRIGQKITVPLSDIYISAVPQTESDIRAGRLPRYGVAWKNKDGLLDTAPGMVWAPDVMAEKRKFRESAAQDIERRRANYATQDEELKRSGVGFIEAGR